jgi:hypothetical protein
MFAQLPMSQILEQHSSNPDIGGTACRTQYISKMIHFFKHLVTIACKMIGISDICGGGSPKFVMRYLNGLNYQRPLIVLPGHVSSSHEQFPSNGHTVPSKCHLLPLPQALAIDYSGKTATLTRKDKDNILFQ